METTRTAETALASFLTTLEETVLPFGEPILSVSREFSIIAMSCDSENLETHAMHIIVLVFSTFSLEAEIGFHACLAH